jgi:exodeoxyribonuclease VII large subunit
LKDASAQIRAVIWRSAATRLAFELQDGMAVHALGGVTVYEPRGEYQVVVQRIEPVGVGALDLAFRQTLARLEAEGLFDPARKRPIPRFPARIAVITSPTGAAVRDVIRVIGARWPLAELLIVPARVQGAGAAAELAGALDLVNRCVEADFVLLTRGGGSLEDLWAFNEEVLARAIVRSRLPVVSAVGHEVDQTIADFAADLRAATPSAAGAVCTPDEVEVRARLDAVGKRLKRVLHERARQARSDLRALMLRGTHALERRWQTERRRLDLLGQRADNAMSRDLDRRGRLVGELAAKVAALSPLSVLARGYSITLDANSRRVIRAAGEVRPGMRLSTRLREGEVESRVEERAGGE